MEDLLKTTRENILLRDLRMILASAMAGRDTAKDLYGTNDVVHAALTNALVTLNQTEEIVIDRIQLDRNEEATDV